MPVLKMSHGLRTTAMEPPMTSLTHPLPGVIAVTPSNTGRDLVWLPREQWLVDVTRDQPGPTQPTTTTQPTFNFNQEC